MVIMEGHYPKHQMKNPTKKEKQYHDDLAEKIGCIICRAIGLKNTHVSIHHIDGRIKKGAHMNVLPLCDKHHQTGGRGVAIHPFKRIWEINYGTEAELKELCDEILAKNE